VVGELRLFYMLRMDIGTSVFGWGHTKNELLHNATVSVH
jgi:hypothetical protein